MDEELTILTTLADPNGDRNITVSSIEDSPMTLVQHGDNTVLVCNPPDFIADKIRAMLVYHPKPWTVNGETVDQGTFPDEPIISTETPGELAIEGRRLDAHDHLHDANCLIDDFFCTLPTMHRLRRFTLTESSSGGKAWKHAIKTMFQPILQLRSEDLGIDLNQDDTEVLEQHLETILDAQFGNLQQLAENQMLASNMLQPITERTWLKSYQNHPRELERNRHDATPITVSGTPVVIRSIDQDFAEQTAAVIALEMADSDLVPIISTHIMGEGPSKPAVEAWFEFHLQHHHAALLLEMGKVGSRSLTVCFHATGYYISDPDDMQVWISSHYPGDEDALTNMIIRCFQPHFLHMLPEITDLRDRMNATIQFTRHARDKARAALHEMTTR